MPTDPMFSRWVTEDTDLCGVDCPSGSVLHICLGAANRDPERWDRPDEYDITPAARSPSLGFGGGPHICLGMHVARAEMTVGINALLDRLPNLRLDPDAEPPRFIGMYERGATAIPCLRCSGVIGERTRIHSRPTSRCSATTTSARYQETDGEVGYLWNGAPTLLLTTTGRKTGEPRTSALIFARDGDDYLVVASMGGAPKHPAWYLNLRPTRGRDPGEGRARSRSTARTASDDEKPRLWQIVNDVWPNYDVYQSRTDREIPVVVLSPVEDRR